MIHLEKYNLIGVSQHGFTKGNHVRKNSFLFYVEVIIGFCKGEPMKNCQGFQSFGLFHKINYCTGCHDMCQSIKLAMGKKGTGWRQWARPWGRKGCLVQGSAEQGTQLDCRTSASD